MLPGIIETQFVKILFEISIKTKNTRREEIRAHIKCWMKFG